MTSDKALLIALMDAQTQRQLLETRLRELQRELEVLKESKDAPRESTETTD